MSPDFRDKIRNPKCKLCPLHKDAEHVCLMGDGLRSAPVMVIGEAPGAREDEEHRAFVGPAGKLLDELMLKLAGLKREDLYITNANKCRPPANRTPKNPEIKTCVEHYLSKELEAVNPDFVLTLGNPALYSMTKKSGIMKHRGNLYDVNGYTVFPTVHPAAVLRNPSYASVFTADLLRFGRLVRGEKSELTTSVRIVANPQHLRWLCGKLAKAKAISYDLETTGLQEWEEGAQIVSIAFTWEAGESAFVPLHHNKTPWRNPQRVLSILKPFLERTDCKYVAHNGKFDCRWLAAAGIQVPQVHDTMLSAHMLDENRAKSLKVLSQLILGADAYGLGEELKDARTIPMKRLAVYNGKDTDYTYRLWRTFREQLVAEPRTARVFQKLMMPASNALVTVERNGLWVDQDRLKKRMRRAQEIENKLVVFMKQHVPKKKRADFNFNSPQQVGPWLFDDLALPHFFKTDAGQRSTNESTLVQLKKEHKAVEALLLYRMWHKRLTTYFRPWGENSKMDGLLHTVYKLFGTVTGRLSSQNPNMQQVPRDEFMRGILGAPPGWTFVGMDYSQIELRIAAFVAHEQRMLRMFAAGEDIHLAMAVRLTGKHPSKITKEERKLAKAVNFGFLYGMYPMKFTIYAKDNFDLDVRLDEAERFRDQFFEQFPALVPWHSRQRRLVHRYGYVVSPLGRKRNLPDIRSGNDKVVKEAERQAINSPVQSTASDITLTSLVIVDGMIDHDEVKIVGTVHDQLLFNIRDEAVEKWVPRIHQAMENPPLYKWFGAQIDVPTLVDVELGQHWGLTDDAREESESRVKELLAA